MPTYTLRGIEVIFPHNAYDCQLAYMSKVIQALQEGTNALLESPTGTGKTLCLLCAALAWRESLRAATGAVVEAPGQAGEVAPAPAKTWAAAMREGMAELQASDPTRLPQLIYASRTHSQLAQVMKELKACGYKPKTSILGSRQQMCQHPAISKLPAAAGNHACRAAVKTRSCAWHNRVEGWVRQNPEANETALDIEDLGRLGRGGGPCPFYTARALADTAELVFMPYNYLARP